MIIYQCVDDKEWTEYFAGRSRWGECWSSRENEEEEREATQKNARNRERQTNVFLEFEFDFQRATFTIFYN